MWTQLEKYSFIQYVIERRRLVINTTHDFWENIHTYNVYMSIMDLINVFSAFYDHEFLFEKTMAENNLSP